MEEFKHPFRKESGGIHKEAEQKKMTERGNKWLRHAVAILARRSATDPFGKICQGHKQNFFDKFISSLFLS